MGSIICKLRSTHRSKDACALRNWIPLWKQYSWKNARGRWISAHIRVKYHRTENIDNKYPHRNRINGWGDKAGQKFVPGIILFMNITFTSYTTSRGHRCVPRPSPLHVSSFVAHRVHRSHPTARPSSSHLADLRCRIFSLLIWIFVTKKKRPAVRDSNLRHIEIDICLRGSLRASLNLRRFTEICHPFYSGREGVGRETLGYTAALDYACSW